METTSKNSFWGIAGGVIGSLIWLVLKSITFSNYAILALTLCVIIASLVSYRLLIKAYPKHHFSASAISMYISIIYSTLFVLYCYMTEGPIQESVSKDFQKIESIGVLILLIMIYSLPIIFVVADLRSNHAKS